MGLYKLKVKLPVNSFREPVYPRKFHYKIHCWAKTLAVYIDLKRLCSNTVVENGCWLQ